MFVILCHSEYIEDSHAYQLVSVDGDYSISKSDVYTVHDLREDIQKGAVPITPKPQMPTGNSWSATLQRKNFPSRWVTINGARVLIKIMNQGKKGEHGVVVFAGNSKLEHLKVYPKTAEEYEEAKKKSALRDKKRKEIARTDKVTAAELEAEKKAIQNRREEKSEVKKDFREQLLQVANLSDEYDEKDIKGAESSLISRAERVEQKERDKALRELADLADDLSEKDKDLLAKDLASKAEESLVEDELKDQMGDSHEELTKGLDPETKEPKKDTTASKDVAVKSVLSRVKLDREQALEISRLNEIKKRSEREINKKYRDQIKTIKGNLEITSMQGVIKVDWDQEVPENDLVESALKNELSRLRAQTNSEYYSLIQSEETGADALNKSGFQKLHDKGSIDTTNILSDIYLDGEGLPSGLTDLIGAENTGRIVAGAIVQEKGKDKALKELEGLMETRAFETVMESLDFAQRKLDRISDYREMIGDGTMRAQTIGAAIGRQHAAINRELGYSLGGLQTVATVADSLRDISAATGDVVIDGGSNYTKLVDRLEAIGLKEDQYSIKRSAEVKGRWELTIPYEKFSSLISENLTAKERDQKVADIKAGKMFDAEWLPTGTAKESYTVYDQKGLQSKKAEWKKEGVLKEKMKGFEKFKNKKGEAGYSSQHNVGTELWRKKGDTRIFPAPQKMMQFGLQQKRAVMNLGAGTGKTVGFLGTVQELKATGKLKTFAFHTMPSRLTKEFYKDRDKFFPDMTVLNLDNVKGGIEGKRKALADAAAGKYDMVISGHDSMKSTAKSKDITDHINTRFEEAWTEKNGGEWVTPTTQERKAFIAENTDAWTKEVVAANDLPSAIRAANPTIVTIDEAHEVVKDWDKKESLRFKAAKTISGGAEYFIPATGTMVKNDIGELSAILHLTRPDLVPSARKHKNQWNAVNQGTSMFGDRAFDSFRRSYDDIMLTEHLELKDVKMTKHESDRLNLSSEQKGQIKSIEDTYNSEKNLRGVAVMTKNGYNLVKDGSDVKIVDPKMKSFTDKDGKPTRRAKKWLSANGFDSNKHELVRLSQSGASARRDSRYKKTLTNGDWKTNVKMDAMSKNVDKYLEQGRRQVMFTNRHDSVSTLKKMMKEKYGFKEGRDFVVITGKTSMKERNKAVAHFNSNPKGKILITNEAGMTGLNLQGGSVNHWIERPNAWYKDKQGNARTYRTGQENDVDSHYYDTNTILEDRIYDNVMKKKRSDEAVGETPDERTRLSKLIVDSQKRIDNLDTSILKKAATPKLTLNV